VGIRAPDAGDAGVIRTLISIITRQFTGPLTCAVVTFVVESTRVIVVTGDAIGRRGAAGIRRAGIFRTGIVVITVECLATEAECGQAVIIGGARIAVFTAQFVGCVNAAEGSVATVIRTGVSVIATDELSITGTIDAHAVCRADIIVRTRLSLANGCVHAAVDRVASVLRAAVSVCTVQKVADTDPL
jgi:hypothetical protein